MLLPSLLQRLLLKCVDEEIGSEMIGILAVFPEFVEVFTDVGLELLDVESGLLDEVGKEEQLLGRELAGNVRFNASP